MAPTSRQLAVLCARTCDDKKSEDTIVLDIRKATYIADYFVVCSVDNPRQAKAIAEGLRAAMKAQGSRAISDSGYQEARWIVMDFSDVIVHIMQEEMRRFYDLESLWADAKRVTWEPKAKSPRPKKVSRTR